jgi:hypothetical protein
MSSSARSHHPRVSFARRGLLFTAKALLVLPFVISILHLIAGTFYVTNPDRPGSLLIGLEGLSTVSVCPPPPSPFPPHDAVSIHFL